MRLGICELYCGSSGKKGYYNNQEIGIARAMKKKGYEIYIFYPDRTTKIVKECEIEEGITVIYCPCKCFGNHSAYDWNVLLGYNIEVVHIGSDNQIFVPALARFCKKHNIVTYNYIGTIESDSGNVIKKLIMGCLMKRNIRYYRESKAYAKTESVRDKLSRCGVDAELAPVGLDLSIIPDEELSEEVKLASSKNDEISLKDRYILFVGRIDEYKNPLQTVDILERLDESYGLLIIGTGALDDSLQQRIERSTAADRIEWIKKVPNQDIHRYYRRAEYFINLNANEIFGMSILEAMYNGCTVVAVHAPGPDSIIVDGKSGYLVDSADDIVDIINQNEHIDGEICRQRVLDNFVWDKTADIFHSWICNRYYSMHR